MKNLKVLNYSLLILAFFLTLFPFLYLAQYNHPSADDFCHSSKASYLGFVAMQLDHWITWSGRYSATALLSIFTLENITLLGYRLIPLIFFLLFGIALYTFFRTLFLKAQNKDIIVLIFVIYFLYLLKSPDITEAFYWLASSVTYKFAAILTLLMFTLILQLLRQKERSKKILYAFLGSFLGIIIVGLNEVSLIYLCIILFFWFIVRFYISREIDWGFLTIVVLTFIAAFISLTAPGNTMRMHQVVTEQYNFNTSFRSSIYLSLWGVKSWLPLLLLLVVIFLNSFKRIALEVKKKYYPGIITWEFISLSILILLGLMAIGFFPTFWSQGWEPPKRTVNIILLIFIFGGIGIILMLLIWMENNLKALTKIPFYVKMVAVFIIFSYITFLTNNIKLAYEDVFLGTAAIYDKEMQERYKLLSECEEGLCDIPITLSAYPPTIVAYELARKPTNELYYYNKCLMDHIHKTYTPPVRELRKE